MVPPTKKPPPAVGPPPPAITERVIENCPPLCATVEAVYKSNIRNDMNFIATPPIPASRLSAQARTWLARSPACVPRSDNRTLCLTDRYEARGPRIGLRSVG